MAVLKNFSSKKKNLVPRIFTICLLDAWRSQDADERSNWMGGRRLEGAHSSARLCRQNDITEDMCLSKGVWALWFYKAEGRYICKGWSGERKLLFSTGRILIGKRCFVEVSQSERTCGGKIVESARVADGTFPFGASSSWSRL